MNCFPKSNAHHAIGAEGVHLIGDLYHCKSGLALLSDAQLLSATCRELCQNAGLQIVGDDFHQFESAGVTGCVLLAESHVAIHTWPEHSCVTIDVYVCNFNMDNSAKAHRVFDDMLKLFTPADAKIQNVRRGEICSEILTEWLTPDSGYCFRTTESLLDVHSAYQHIQVYDTPQFGKLLRLDGSFMTSETDEFFYHENIVHPAAITHPGIKRVLVIGGGDGGVSKEVFKYSSVEKLTLVELDPAVIDVARKYLGKVHGGAMDDPRFELRIEDGEAFVFGTKEKFDLVILDLTDPAGVAAGLYKREFFAACRAILNPGGALTMHIGAPIFHPMRVRENVANLKQVFSIVRPYLVTVPLYGTLWGFVCASDSLDPLCINEAEVERRITERGLSNLQFYNGATHHGVFALPNFVRRLTEHIGDA